MAGMSPLLQSRLNIVTTNQDNKQKLDNRHEKIYQDLKKRAHEAKPNEPKAVMVKEGILGNPITSTKDMFKDGKNFFETVKTGKMSDNSLGRINDLGLKMGAVIIATYLAAHSKSKTESLMRFIGGGMFVAAMDLWPKLFINLPARLIHGFRIDRKYISAQNDKKDFFLDNQFLVWDAYPEEQLRKDAERAGIDYDSENGKEKIQRKMQKTAVQNRALWMATAGFSTPLMTALTCNAVEPYVKKGISVHNFNKVKNIVSNPEKFKQYLDNAAKNAKPSADGLKAIDTLYESYKDGKIMRETLFQELNKQVFALSTIQSSFKDSDDAKILKDYASDEIAKFFEDLYENSRVKLADINDSGANETVKQIIKQKVKTILNNDLCDDDLNEIMSKIGNDFSSKNVINAVNSTVGEKKINLDRLNGLVDEEGFIKKVKEYYVDVCTPLQARAKAYIELLDPVIGESAESVRALEFEKTIKQTIKTFDNRGIMQKIKDFFKPDKKALLKSENNSKSFVEEFFDSIEGAVGGDEAKYKKIISSLNCDDFSEDVKNVLTELMKKENLDLISGTIDADDSNKKELIRRILGIAKDNNSTGVGNKNGLADVLSHFVKTKKIDIESIKLRPVLCANLERRIAKNKLTHEFTSEEIKKARKFIEDSSLAQLMNLKYATEKGINIVLLEKIFDEDKFQVEKDAVLFANLNLERRIKNNEFGDFAAEEIKKAKGFIEDSSLAQTMNPEYATEKGINIDLLKKIFNVDELKVDKAERNLLNGKLNIEDYVKTLKDMYIQGDGYIDFTPEEKYLKNASFKELIKDYGTRLKNNKAWMKIFVPAAVALVAITLLVQPFFGKIDKEFPEKEKGGTK